MPDSAVFDRTCEELEARTSLERLEVRGTVRIGLKSAGLDVQSVGGAQMAVVLRKVLPTELERRGVGGASALCAEIAGIVESLAGSGDDRAGAAAQTLERFGG